MSRLIIEPEVEADIAQAYDWYEKKRAGLGDDFEMCLDEGLHTLFRGRNHFKEFMKM